MENTISDRISLLINELGYNKRTFSQAIGLGNDVTIGRIVNEHREPSYKILNSIIQTFGNINANWLITGEGEIFRKNVQVDVQVAEKNPSEEDQILCKENIHPNIHPNIHLTEKNGQANGQVDGQVAEKSSSEDGEKLLPELSPKGEKNADLNADLAKKNANLNANPDANLTVKNAQVNAQVAEKSPSEDGGKLSPELSPKGEKDAYLNADLAKKITPHIGPSKLSSYAVPYYDIPVSAGPLGVLTYSRDAVKPDGYIDMEIFRRCEAILPVIGVSMEPEIHSGDLIGIRKLEYYSWEYIETGKIYMIITQEDRMIKYINKADDPDYIVCSSPNYYDFKIRKADVLEIYRVIANIRAL